MVNQRSFQHFNPDWTLSPASAKKAAMQSLVKKHPLRTGTEFSVIIPTYNEEKTISRQLEALSHQYDDKGIPIDPNRYEVVVVNNRSTDNTEAVVEDFASKHPAMQLVIISEDEKGTAPARQTGMNFAALRSQKFYQDDYYLLTTDADCQVGPQWTFHLVQTLKKSSAAMSISRYKYDANSFITRPRLWNLIKRSLKHRHVMNSLFGGLPEGRGYAVKRSVWDESGGIEIFYQVDNKGRFVIHCTDDMDFATKLRAINKDIVYAPKSEVLADPRRINLALTEMINGQTYGRNGILVHTDLRSNKVKLASRDLTEKEEKQLQDFVHLDNLTKYIILPIFLTPKLFENKAVQKFLTTKLAKAMKQRMTAIRREEGLKDYRKIHSYRTAIFRIYFEFAPHLFKRCREVMGADFGEIPNFPSTLSRENITALNSNIADYKIFIKYYCDTAEGRHMYNYFGNGGVF